MARILNVSDVHLGRLAKAGTIPGPVAKGQWDVVAVVQAYVAHLESRGKGSPEGVKSEELRLIVARREKAEAETEQQRMRNAATRGELLPRSEVDAAVTAAFARVRARVLALPSKLAPVLLSLRTAAEVRERMAEAVHDALDELAATSVAGVPGPDWSFTGDADGGGGVVASDGAASGSDRKPVGRSRKAAQPGIKRGARPVGHKPG